MGIPSSSAIRATSSGDTTLASSGPLEKTTTTLRPGTRAASRMVSRVAFSTAVASPAAGLLVVIGQTGQPAEILAERVHRHGLARVQVTYKIRNHVLCERKTFIHAVARIEQDKDAVRNLCRLARLARRIRVDCARRIHEALDLLLYAVLAHADLCGLQASHVLPVAVLHGEAHHHRPDIHMKNCFRPRNP